MSIAGAQRLRLTVQEVDLDGEGSCGANDYDAAVWADPELT